MDLKAIQSHFLNTTTNYTEVCNNLGVTAVPTAISNGGIVNAHDKQTEILLACIKVNSILVHAES